MPSDPAETEPDLPDSRLSTQSQLQSTAETNGFSPLLGQAREIWLTKCNSVRYRIHPGLCHHRILYANAPTGADRADDLAVHQNWERAL